MISRLSPYVPPWAIDLRWASYAASVSLSVAAVNEKDDDNAPAFFLLGLRRWVPLTQIKGLNFSGFSRMYWMTLPRISECLAWEPKIWSDKALNKQLPTEGQLQWLGTRRVAGERGEWGNGGRSGWWAVPCTYHHHGSGRPSSRTA
jgi:hypothetical protein